MPSRYIRKYNNYKSLSVLNLSFHCCEHHSQRPTDRKKKMISSKCSIDFIFKQKLDRRHTDTAVQDLHGRSHSMPPLIKISYRGTRNSTSVLASQPFFTAAIVARPGFEEKEITSIDRSHDTDLLSGAWHHLH